MARKVVPRREITQEMLKKHLLYDPESGIFTWEKPRGYRVRRGDLAGSPHGPYIVIGLFGLDHYAQQLAWLYMTGAWPKGQIDHEDRNGANNRWENLRPATPQQNTQNRRMRSKTGYTGVTAINTGGFSARVTIDSQRTYLGWFATAEEAHLVAVGARNAAHAEFSITRGEA